MIVIDVEIVKGILGRDEQPLEDIQYCGGWRDFAGMGVSVACTFDLRTRLSRCFFEEELAELQSYVAGKPTAGFNTRRFDLPLLAHYGVSVDQGQHFDVLESIWLALGLNPDRFEGRTHGGWSLDAVMQGTFGLSKSGHGAMAPVWWQRGQRGKVIDYCLRDVWLEGRLVEHALSGATLINTQGGTVRIRTKEAA